MSTYKLLTEEFESKEEFVRPAKKRASINTWLEWISKVLSLDKDSKLRTEIGPNRRHFYLISTGFKANTGHKELHIKLESSPAIL